MSKLYGFGSNGNGQLGLGHVEDTHKPTLCIGIPDHEVIIKISGGGNHSAVVTESGKVYFAGFSQLGENYMQYILKASPEKQQAWTVYQERFSEIKWKDVACGWASTLLLSQEGKVYGVGSSRWNEIDGKKDNKEQELTEILIHEDIVSVACGWRHAVALSNEGNVFGWGWGRHGQLGPSKVETDKKDIRSIQKIELPQKILQVACGHLYTIFRAEDGSVYGVGSNKYGQLDNKDNEVRIVEPRVVYRNSVYIDAGWHHTLSLGSVGELKASGRKDHGQITKSHLLQNIKQFCCGSEHTLAIQEDRLIGWGWNEHGNCATDKDFTDEPIVISTSTKIRAFGAGCATSWFAVIKRFYSMSTSPRILTVGTGAVGAIYSWRLAKSCEITAVCRSNFQNVLEKGFDINSAKFGQEIFHPHKVVRTVSDSVTSVPFDYVLVTLKALPEVYNVADIISPAIKDENTAIVLIQNGLGVEEPIVERFSNNPIISIVAYIGTSQHEPGKITMLGNESLIVGKYLKAKRSSVEQQAKLVEYLKKGGVDVQEVDNIEKTRWQKLLWNASFSPICTLTGMNTNEVLENEEATKAVKALINEMVEVANAEGCDFDVEQQTETMIARTYATAKNYKPSMQLDKERGSPMEIEAILGNALKRAKTRGLSVPQLEMVHSIYIPLLFAQGLLGIGLVQLARSPVFLNKLTFSSLEYVALDL
ncbi:hypothetical protein G6F43_000258 [Rhizopus delemar]|nr:hypothetical protein G6F43_000258 [Rhizopus delemar]